MEIVSKLKYSTEDFISLAKKIHGDKFDYSKVNYTGKHNKIIIICPIHGEYTQTPHNHQHSKYGCGKCGKLERGAKKSLEDFIDDAHMIHMDYYSYEKVVYVNNCTNVTITCPVHGDFQMTPNNHINSVQGCKICNSKNNK